MKLAYMFWINNLPTGLDNLYVDIVNIGTKRNYFRIIMVNCQVSILSPCKYSHVTFFLATLILPRLSNGIKICFLERCKS